MQNKFKEIEDFLEVYPDLCPKAPEKRQSEKEKKDWLFAKFSRGRDARIPKCPKTKPDPMIEAILDGWFGCPQETLAQEIDAHNRCMAAENIIGHYLELYLASVLEKRGWVWCSGDMVKATDFIKRTHSGEWIALQVKNRQNSENSSSNKIREGTGILHWFRTFPYKETQNWEDFPDEEASSMLSEEGFRIFVKNILGNLK